jgi:hypothetical protein
MRANRLQPERNPAAASARGLVASPRRNSLSTFELVLGPRGLRTLSNYR